MSHVAPIFKADAFNCPHCGAFSHQFWIDLTTRSDQYGQYEASPFKRSKCNKCKGFLYWFKESIIVPDVSGAPIPNSDMPTSVLNAYEEARSIASKSPRGSAALLRLAVQLLCEHLGYKEKDINKNIGKMVKDGLPSLTQKALDSVRVIGNHAVHPGVINFEDKPETSAKLFNLINFIVEKMISEPKQVEDFFETQLPEGAKEGIEIRDKAKEIEE